jgi:hypothetical protein
VIPSSMCGRLEPFMSVTSVASPPASPNPGTPRREQITMASNAPVDRVEPHVAVAVEDPADQVEPQPRSSDR